MIQTPFISICTSTQTGPIPLSKPVKGLNSTYFLKQPIAGPLSADSLQVSNAVPLSKPRPSLKRAERILGSQTEALEKALAKTHDRPYMAGKLINGKCYLLSENDELYYGKPGQMKRLPLKTTYRTRCMDQQKRVVETHDGLRLTLQRKHGKTNASLSKALFLGLRLPIPHRDKQAF